MEVFKWESQYFSNVWFVFKRYEPEVSETLSKPQVKDWLHRKIFNEEFSLSFGYPHGDTCETCGLSHVAIQSASDEQQEKYQKDLADH